MPWNRIVGSSSLFPPNGLERCVDSPNDPTLSNRWPAPADAVVDHRVAAADDHLVARQPAEEAASAGRPRRREPRREVVLVPVVEARPAVGGAGEDRTDSAEAVLSGMPARMFAPRMLEQIAEVDVRAPPAGRWFPMAARTGCSAARRSPSGLSRSSSCPARRTRTRPSAYFLRAGRPTGSTVPSDQ